MLRGVTTVVYQASDLAAAAKWYSELLGTEPYYNTPFYIEFRIGDYQHELGILSAEGAAMLGAATGETPPATTPADGAATSGVLAYWHVDDIEAAYARLLEMGAREHFPPREFGEGFIGGSVIDPFGNIFAVMQNQHYLDVLERIPPFELPEVKPGP